jgi:hypothetical protein
MWELIGLLITVAVAGILFVMVLFRFFSSDGKSRGVAAVRQVQTAGRGLKKAGKVFFWLALALGVTGFFLIGPMAVYAASGFFTLAFILWVIGACLP